MCAFQTHIAACDPKDMLVIEIASCKKACVVFHTLNYSAIMCVYIKYEYGVLTEHLRNLFGKSSVWLFFPLPKYFLVCLLS